MYETIIRILQHHGLDIILPQTYPQTVNKLLFQTALSLTITKSDSSVNMTKISS